MASAMRSSVLRQALAASTKRTFPMPSTSTGPSVSSRLCRRSPLLQRATFQTSSRRSILPALPQKVEGSVNDPVKVPEPHPAHGSYHWTAERIVSTALIPITVAPFAAGALNPLLDGALIGLILVHSHVGFQSSIIDYLPKRRVPKTRALFDWGTTLALFVVGWGWYEFETNDVGLTEGVRRVWTA